MVNRIDAEWIDIFTDRAVIACEEEFGKFIEGSEAPKREVADYLSPQIKKVVAKVVTEPDMTDAVYNRVINELFQ